MSNRPNMNVIRVFNELKHMKADQLRGDLGFKVISKNDSATKIVCELAGPDGTPYEGGKYLVTILIPEKYPYVFPKYKFTTKVWHPNVNHVNGELCGTPGDSVATTISSIVLSMQALLSSPDPNDPMDTVVASQYMNDYQLFEKTARFWAKKYADAPAGDDSFEDMLNEMNNFGISEYRSMAALSKANWNIDEAKANIKESYFEIPPKK